MKIRLESMHRIIQARRTIPYKRVDTPSMIKFVDAAIEKFNLNELSTDKTTIKDCFTKVGQNPWYEDEDKLLVVKLEEFKEYAHFKRDAADDMLENNSHTIIEAEYNIPFV